MPHPIYKCPICGKNEWVVMIVTGPFPEDFGTYIICDSCKSQTATYKSRAEAIEAWNNGIIDTAD